MCYVVIVAIDIDCLVLLLSSCSWYVVVVCVWFVLVYVIVVFVWVKVLLLFCCLFYIVSVLLGVCNCFVSVRGIDNIIGIVSASVVASASVLLFVVSV